MDKLDKFKNQTNLSLKYFRFSFSFLILITKIIFVKIIRLFSDSSILNINDFTRFHQIAQNPVKSSDLEEVLNPYFQVKKLFYISSLFSDYEFNDIFDLLVCVCVVPGYKFKKSKK
jgi:hypothetical protein